MDRVVARPFRSWQGWLDRALVSHGSDGSLLAVLAIGGGLVLCYALSWGLGGGRLVASSWYIPMILLAAGRFRYRGAVAAAVAAALLAGPLRRVPALAQPDGLTLWLGRGMVFVLVGLVTAALIEQIVAGRERELVLAEQERDLAVRQAAVIATVSHEFRTPLTVITGVARTLEAQDMVSPEGIPLLEGLSDATRRLTDLVNAVGAVMDGASSETFVRRETVVLRDVLTRIVLTLGVRDPKSRVSFDVEPNAELFTSDPELLGQLLRHIIENAVKFSPAGDPVLARFWRIDGRLHVCVRDRGPGIDEAVLRSSGPFAQGDRTLTRTHQGLGLGLFAAKQLADALDGSIVFGHREGGGTEVSIEIGAPDP